MTSCLTAILATRGITTEKATTNDFPLFVYITTTSI